MPSALDTLCERLEEWYRAGRISPSCWKGFNGLCGAIHVVKQQERVNSRPLTELVMAYLGEIEQPEELEWLVQQVESDGGSR